MEKVGQNCVREKVCCIFLPLNTHTPWHTTQVFLYLPCPDFEYPSATRGTFYILFSSPSPFQCFVSVCCCFDPSMGKMTNMGYSCEIIQQHFASDIIWGESWLLNGLHSAWRMNYEKTSFYNGLYSLHRKRWYQSCHARPMTRVQCSAQGHSQRLLDLYWIQWDVTRASDYQMIMLFCHIS